jgi:hypothetical protein
VSVKVGDVYVITRWLRWVGGRIEHQWEAPVDRVTGKRAYVGRHWFELSDPKRIVKPKYIDYTMTAEPKEM